MTRRGIASAVWGSLVSNRTAIALIVAVTALALVGVLWPQDRMMSPSDVVEFEQRYGVIATIGSWAGFGHLFSTWYFLGTLGLLALSLIGCTLDRLRRRRRAHSFPTSVPAGTTVVATYSLDRARAAALGALTGPGRVRIVEGDRGLLALGGRLGFWGSMLFHAALLIVGIGGVLSVYTSFQGTMVIAEGQTLIDEPASYVSVAKEPQIGDAFTGAGITLERLEMQYDGSTLTRAIAQFTAQDEGAVPSSESVQVNYPLDVGWKSYLLGNSGYAAAVEASTEGQTLYSGVVNLGERTDSGYADTVALPDGSELKLSATGDSLAPSEGRTPRRYELASPQLEVELVRNGTGWGDAVLSPGQSATIGGTTITFGGLRLWNELMVRGDRGRYVVYVGFWLCVVGVLARLADPKRQVLIVSADGKTVVAARHRYGAASADALERRAAALLEATRGAEDAE